MASFRVDGREAPATILVGKVDEPILGVEALEALGGYWLGGSATLCGKGPNQSLCSTGIGFSTPGVAAEIVQYGFVLFQRK